MTFSRNRVIESEPISATVISKPARDHQQRTPKAQKTQVRARKERVFEESYVFSNNISIRLPAPSAPTKRQGPELAVDLYGGHNSDEDDSYVEWYERGRGRGRTEDDGHDSIMDLPWAWDGGSVCSCCGF